MRRFHSLCLIVIVFLVGCSQQQPVRVGSKVFTENQILAEMMAAILAEQGIPVEKTVPFGNTFALQQAIRKDTLDLYPEYTGTGAMIMGAAVPSDPEETLQSVRRLFKPLGIAWLEPLGFDNTYVVVMTPAKASDWEADSISDLAGREEEFTLGADPEFLRRAVDGLPSLVRRYGISPRPKTVAQQDSEKLYGKLLAGDADVVVGNRTDPQIAEFNLITLEDDLGFFPVYQPAPLVREAILQQHPGLASALASLVGSLDVQTMRMLNLKVDQQGLAPQEVALTWLVQQGLLKRRPPRPYQRALIVAAPPMDDTPPSTARALQAMRQVFPDRPVQLNTVAFPAESLKQGLAFVAVLGAEHFFRMELERPPKLIPGVEAVAPVGFRVAYLIVRENRVRAREPFQRISRMGVGLINGSSERVARLLVDAYSADVELVTGDPSEQVGQVVRGKLDALLMMAPQGDAGVIVTLNRHHLALQPLTAWGREDRQHRYPFFRLTRLPAGVYPGQKQPVETVGAQVVLAAPRPEQRVLGIGDPVAGLRTQREALPDELKRHLTTALDAKEAIDPVLPGRNVLVVRRAPPPAQALNPDPRGSLFNGLPLAVLVGFFVLLKRAGRSAGRGEVSRPSPKEWND